METQVQCINMLWFGEVTEPLCLCVSVLRAAICIHLVYQAAQNKPPNYSHNPIYTLLFRLPGTALLWPAQTMMHCAGHSRPWINYAEVGVIISQLLINSR